MEEQGIDKGSRLVSWSRMNHEAGGFVQDENVGVFIEDRQGNRFRLTGDGLWGWDFRPDNVSTFGDIPGFLRQAIDRNVARPNQSADIGSGQVGESCCYDRVKATTCFRFGGRKAENRHSPLITFLLEYGINIRHDRALVGVLSD